MPPQILNNSIRLLSPLPIPNINLYFPYSKEEIREGIKQFYYLPEHSSLVIDLRRIYDLLGIEYQTIFDLYALGYSLASIAYYYNSIHKREGEANKNLGNRIIRRLTREIQYLFSLSLRIEEGPNISMREKRKEIRTNDDEC